MTKTKIKKPESALQTGERPGLVGYISLAIFLVVFSGVFKDLSGWCALDFTGMAGKFGTIGDTGANLLGSGGTGAKEGFLSALGNVPTVMFAMGLVELVTHYRGLLAAKVIFTPILKPILGIPGSAGMTFVASLNSSDAAAAMTRDLYDNQLITQNQRTIFATYQFAGSATITNTVTCIAMVPMVKFSLLAYIGIILVMKFLAANLMRLILSAGAKKEKPDADSQAQA